MGRPPDSQITGDHEAAAGLDARAGAAPACGGLTASPARPIQRSGLALGWQGVRREAHLSAEQHRSQAAARLSRPHGNRWRPSGDRAAACQGSQAAVLLSGRMPLAGVSLGDGRKSEASVTRLKRRREFLAVAATGRRWVTPAFVLQVGPRAAAGQDPEIGLGFTASRRVGKAVARNRARRRLAEAARKVLPGAARAGLQLCSRCAAGGPDMSFRSSVERADHRLCPGHPDGAARRASRRPATRAAPGTRPSGGP